MKIAGLLVLPAGFFLVAASLVLFSDTGRRTAFVLCGLLVEAVGIGVALRGHMPLRGEDRQ